MLKTLKEDQSYTFRSFFELKAEPEEILADLGYRLVSAKLNLPQTTDRLDWQTQLLDRLEQSLTVVSLTSETARRETLVAPILLEIATRYQFQLRIEYPLTVSHWLKGYLDYLLRSSSSLIVVEAKNDDLTRGFTQLAAEMIALAQAQELDSLYGAVTIGEAWRFGYLDAIQKHITQDVTLYTIPDRLGTLLSIVIGILQK
jgi:hypothetical protein